MENTKHFKGDKVSYPGRYPVLDPLSPEDFEPNY